MAVTSSNYLDLTPEIQPYTGLGQLTQDRSAIPRAEVFVGGLDIDITAGGVGNTQRFTLGMHLPRNFAYVLAEINVVIEVEAGLAMTWDAYGAGELSNGPDQDRSHATPISLESPGVSDSTGNPRRIYTAPHPPKYLVLPPENKPGPYFALVWGNSTTDAPAAVSSFLIRFYQYDVEQAHHFAVNSPSLTR